MANWTFANIDTSSEYLLIALGFGYLEQIWCKWMLSEKVLNMVIFNMHVICTVVVIHFHLTILLKSNTSTVFQIKSFTYKKLIEPHLCLENWLQRKSKFPFTLGMQLWIFILISTSWKTLRLWAIFGTLCTKSISSYEEI